MTTANIILTVLGVVIGAVLIALIADSIYKYEKKKMEILDYIAAAVTKVIVEGEKKENDKRI